MAPPMFRYLACLAVAAPVASAAQWYEEMQVGPARSDTFEDQFHGETRVGALKGILVNLGDGYKVLFDTETLRVATAYKGEFKWGGTPWTGEHGPLLSLKDEGAIFQTAATPGWQNPAGNFDDIREIPGFGNLDYAHYLGYYRHGNVITFHYEVRGADVLETFSRDGSTIVLSYQIGNRDNELVLAVADEKGDFTVGGDMASAKSADGLAVTATGGVKLAADAGRLLAEIPKGGDTLNFQIALNRGGDAKPTAAPDFKELTSGGDAIWPKIIETKGTVSGGSDAPYVTDVATLPEDNPWKANLRFGGFDFIDEDSAALSSWNGDVWVVRGLKGTEWSHLKWQRIAAGLFQTLGVKVVKGKIYVHGRDQITELIDLNGDGEIDYFKCFNRDTIITAGFHEFAFDLQTDDAGNFYISKAAPVRSGGRGFDQIQPHHGIVAKISADGKKFEILATGLRAPGGLGIGPDGLITTGENEGTWQMACKINYFHQQDGPVFLGTEPSRGALTDAPYHEPLCYLPMDVDNSGGSQVWVPKDADFGVPAGSMLHLSYGQSSIFEVLPVPRKNGGVQGGVVKLPISLQSSAMRGRFHPDGSLFVLGFRGWQTNAATECAFQRVRHNPDVTVLVPDKVAYSEKGILLTFPVKLDQELAEDPASYGAERWNYVRGPQYGSGEFSVDHPDVEAEKMALQKESKDHHVHDTAEIESAKLSADGKTVEIGIVGMKASHTLKVTYDLEDTDGAVIKGEFDGTVYKD